MDNIRAAANAQSQWPNESTQSQDSVISGNGDGDDFASGNHSINDNDNDSINHSIACAYSHNPGPAQAHAQTAQVYANNVQVLLGYHKFSVIYF